MSDLTAELIQRLDRPGPRYTSYPTAPIFSQSFSGAAYREALTLAALEEGPIKLYVHLPFCERLCTYCACNVVVRRDIQRAGDPYLEAVLDEARAVAALLKGRRPVSRLQLGGGTPNYLEPAQLTHLVHSLQEIFPFAEGADLAIEADPRHASPEQIAWLAELGFNRLSMGVQDFDLEVQEAIGRHQSWEQTQVVVEGGRANGYRSVNIDLVYGLPGQTEASLAATLDKVVALAPDRLAVFSFAYVPKVKPHQAKIPAEDLPPADEKARFLVQIIDRLRAAGYVQVGMDHFARPDDDLARSFQEGSLVRSFQGYEAGPAMETVALGATAIGDIGGAYVQNAHRVSDYQQAVSEGGLAVERGWTRSHEDEVRRAAVWSLMCRFKLDYAELRDRFGVDHDAFFREALPALGETAADGLIEQGADGIQVTELGRLFVRNVAMAYDAYLKPGGGNFSRTV